MAAPLQVDIVLTGLQQVVGGLGQVATAVGSIGNSQTQQAKGAQSQASQLAAALRLQRASLGVQSAQIRLQQQQMNLQNQINKAQRQSGASGGGFGGGASFGSRLMNVLASSRFHVGANGVSLMPLLGRFSSLLGEGLAGPIAVASLAAMTLYSAAKSAAEALNGFREAMFIGGGSRYETAQLKLLGGALGMQPGEMAQTARQFADEISSNGIAMGAANQMGIHDYGVFDTTNKTAKLLDAIEKLRHMPEQQAIRMARQIPALEKVLGARDLPESDWQQLKVQASESAKAMTPEATQQARIFTAELSKFSDEMTRLAITVLPMVTWALKVLNDAVDFIFHPSKTPGTAPGILGNNPPFGGKNGKLSTDPLKDAIEKNTDAVNQNTQATNGIYGGGNAVRNAYPSAWGGMQWQKLRGDAYNLGVFAS